MGAGAGGAAEQHGVVALQPLGHVVGIQDGQLGGLLRSRGAGGGAEGGCVEQGVVGCRCALHGWAPSLEGWPGGRCMGHMRRLHPAALAPLAARVLTLVSAWEPIMEM